MPASVIALPGCLRFRNFCARPLVLLMASFPLVDPDAGGLAFDLNSEALILNTYNNTMKKVKQETAAGRTKIDHPEVQSKFDGEDIGEVGTKLELHLVKKETQKGQN